MSLCSANSNCWRCVQLSELSDTKHKYLTGLKIFLLCLYTDLRTEPHTTSLHDTVECKFWSVSWDMALQPGHGTWLFPEDFAANPPTGILDRVSGLLANNVRRLEIVFINYHEMGNFNQRIGGVKRSNQINCRHLLATEDLWESLTEGQVRPAYLLVSIKLDLYPETSLPRGQALVKKLQVKKRRPRMGQ